MVFSLHRVEMNKDDSRPLTRDIAPFGVRMPADLKARVQAAAEKNNRSMNAEIVARLENSFLGLNIDVNDDVGARYMAKVLSFMIESGDDQIRQYALAVLKNASQS